MNTKTTANLTILLLALTIGTTFAQTNSHKKTLAERIGLLDFLVVRISHGAERYIREEINIIYYQDSVLKIHSILKSNNSSEKQIDTLFSLSRLQLTKLDKFGKDFNNKNNVGDQVWLAGTKTFFTIIFKGETMTFDNKSGYSLLLDLLLK